MLRLLPLLFLTCLLSAGEALGTPGAPRSVGRSLELDLGNSWRLRLTPYGDHVLRIQAAIAGAEFLADARYPIIERHDVGGTLSAKGQGEGLTVATAAADGLEARFAGGGLALFQRGRGEPLLILEQLADVLGSKGQRQVQARFKPQAGERFAGGGHGSLGNLDAVDRTGKRIGLGYGGQAPLIVPFLLSSRGYGILVNSTWPMDLQAGPALRATLNALPNEPCQMDLCIIAGPDPVTLLDRYTALTGRPRLPAAGAFGMGQSDKGGAGKLFMSTTQGWQDRIEAQWKAGFPFDHVVNDNRWRAGGGSRTESRLEWDLAKYPDPKAYATWLRERGVMITIDFNRVNAQKCKGWTNAFNVGASFKADDGTAGEEAGEKAATGNRQPDTSWPDMSRPEVRSWFWSQFFVNVVDPKLGYPGDALWIDEFDAYGPKPETRLGDGTTWRETSAAWFTLIGKSLVEEGWDRQVGPSRRPFVWIRGAGAGMQRWGTLWTGDITFSFTVMKSQLRAMLAAGMGGFPFHGHDQGGFMKPYGAMGDAASDCTPELYRRWSLAAGCFTPFWKPHGQGPSRWPLDRSPAEQSDARRYMHLRHALFPYTYAAAVRASQTGLPITQAMLLRWPGLDEAWKRDLQWLWGDDLLVAPATSAAEDHELWLPPGTWIDWWTGERKTGPDVIARKVPMGDLPLYVRAGGLVAMAKPGNTLMRQDWSALDLHLWPGADGTMTLVEDDRSSEGWRSGERRTTTITWTESTRTLAIAPAKGAFPGAPATRTWRLLVHAGPGAAAPADGYLPSAPTATMDLGTVASAQGVSTQVP